MRRVTAGIWGSPAMENAFALTVPAVFFALGSVLGCLLAARAGGAEARALEEYLAAFLREAEEGTLRAPELPGIFWRTARWPLGAVLLGFTSLGLVGVPVLSALRGFLLTFSIEALARVYGWTGIRVSFYLVGVTSLISVPVFLFLAARSFRSALHLAFPGLECGRREKTFLNKKGRPGCLALCAVALGACILVERYLVPAWTASVIAAR